MTKEEFLSKPFHMNIWVQYKGERYWVASCCWAECLYGLLPERNLTNAAYGQNDIRWVRCESVELFEEKF